MFQNQENVDLFVSKHENSCSIHAAFTVNMPK
jgi:hypothetical protein